MENKQMLETLQKKMKESVPDFELRFKNESKFMKFLGKLLFFNKSFMTGFITTIATKVYWTTKEKFDSDPVRSFLTLAHEYVHVLDHVQKPVRFPLGYLFPQILAAPALLFVLLSPVLIPLIALGILSPYLLLSLVTLAFLAPIPSPGRKSAEMRGYGMSIKVNTWLYGSVNQNYIDWCAKQFTGPAYFYMWPFESKVKKELAEWADIHNLKCLSDKNRAYKEVFDIIKV